MQMLRDSISPEMLDKARADLVERRPFPTMGEAMAQAESNRHARRAAEALAAKTKEFAR